MPIYRPPRPGAAQSHAQATNSQQKQQKQQKQQQQQQQQQHVISDDTTEKHPTHKQTDKKHGSATEPATQSSTPITYCHSLRSNTHSLVSASNSAFAHNPITVEEFYVHIATDSAKLAGLSESSTSAAASANMADNKRRRVPSSSTAQEETSMWNQIVADLKQCRDIKREYEEMTKELIEKEEVMAAEKAAGKGPSVAKIDELTTLYNEIKNLIKKEQKILHEEPHDVIRNLSILQALRAASAAEPRTAQQTKPPRIQKNKSKAEADGLADSPGPSPNVTTPATKLKGSSVRSGSVPSTKGVKEASVKIEEGAEGSKGPYAEKAGKFHVGAVVAYKQAKVKDDGSQWIQCNIIAISEVGNKKRYEVQDPEPDESGAPGQIYKTSAVNMIAIPTPDTILAELQVGKHVLARYPETTTFYRAEVTAVRKETCMLKFEDDQNQEMEVARRFVLDLGGK